MESKTEENAFVIKTDNGARFLCASLAEAYEKMDELLRAGDDSAEIEFPY